MTTMLNSLGAKKFLLCIIALLISTDLAILLNILFLRQIFGFLFLTILPGLLILQILKLNKLGSTEKFVLTVGLCISFLMLFGLLLNNLLLSLGYKTPLSTISLLILFNLAFIALAIIGYKRNTDLILSLPHPGLSTSEKAFLSVPILFPALSIFGMHLMNTTDNNVILMVLLFLIPIYVAFVCFFNHKFPKRLYPVVIFLISISLLLLMSLRSNHIIIGSDTGAELYFFRTTLSNLHWSIIGHSTLDACLSISLLPTIYQSILGVNEEYLFKVLYSLIFSISPLAIYTLSKKYIGSFYAFLASFFFMSQLTFLWTPSTVRTNTAILFCALAIMTLFHDGISKVNKKLLFIIFLASVIVSHYSTTYIFFFMLLLTWLWMQMLPKVTSHKRKPVTPSKNHLVGGWSSIPLLQKGSLLESDDVVSRTAAFELPHLRKGISLSVITLFFAIIFLWYSQLTEVAFSTGVGFIERTIINLNEFFVLESRGSGIPILMGIGLKCGIVSKINFLITWMTFILIGIGVISMIYRYSKMLTSFGTTNSESKFLKTKFEMEYLAMTIVCCIILFTMVALPFISQGYDVQRLYLQMMIVLSLCFVLGGIMLSLVLQFVFTNGIRCFRVLKSYLGRRICKNTMQSEHNKCIKIQPFLVILIILILYFLNTTGVSYQIFGIPIAITLNSKGLNYDTRCIHDQESYTSKWLGRYGEHEETIYSNNYGREILGSQGKIPPSRVNPALIPTYEKTKKIEGYIFLEYHTVVSGEIIIFPHEHAERHNITEYSQLFVGKNKIYANGGSEVYK